MQEELSASKPAHLPIRLSRLLPAFRETLRLRHTLQRKEFFT